MKRMIPALAMVAALAIAGAAAPSGPRIVTEDVDRFYALYDREGGRPSAGQIQAEYLDRGTAGLTAFARLRRVTADRIAESIAREPGIYEDAKACVRHLPEVRERLETATTKLTALYPQARVPPVSIVIGRGRPVGIGGVDGVMIGLEALCAWSAPDPNVEDRMVHVIAHEYVHVQQAGFMQEGADDTVLEAAMTEGVAEFVGELISGSVAYKHLVAAGKGKECDLDRAFLADATRPAAGSAWVYNGAGTPERPGDLGYWIGYRIAKTFYLRADGKTRAVRDLIEMTDPAAILARSGWTPGTRPGPNGRFLTNACPDASGG